MRNVLLAFASLCHTSVINMERVSWLDAVIDKRRITSRKTLFSFRQQHLECKDAYLCETFTFFWYKVPITMPVVREVERDCSRVSRERKVNCSTIFLHFSGLKSVRTRLALISSNVKQSCVECVHGGRGFPIQLMTTLQTTDNSPRCSYDHELSLSSWEATLWRRTCGASNRYRETRRGGKPSV